MAGRMQSQQIAETDFSGVLSALSSTAKGRGFLAEYLRRYRPKETRTLLAALQRIEATVRILRDQIEPERLGSELRRIASTLDIAVEDARAADKAGDPERRTALLARASADLTALAESLSGSGPAAPSATGSDAEEQEVGADVIEDDLMLVDQLGDNPDGAER